MYLPTGKFAFSVFDFLVGGCHEIYSALVGTLGLRGSLRGPLRASAAKSRLRAVNLVAPNQKVKKTKKYNFS